MAELDKDALRSEVEELVAKLRPQLQADQKRITSEGRSFSPMQWLLSVPDTGKYPAGPAFLPMGTSPSFWSCLMLMNAQDVATTAMGGAFFYAMGFAHATKLGVASGHRLGFWTAVPAVVLGLMGGINKGAYRYAGYLENGNPSLYPGYVENSAPYFLKHKVSDRVADVAPGVVVDPSKNRRLQ